MKAGEFYFDYEGKIACKHNWPGLLKKFRTLQKWSNMDKAQKIAELKETLQHQYRRYDERLNHIRWRSTFIH